MLKAWLPGVVEACARADFADAMGDLRGGDRVTFEHVCEVAAALLASKDKVRI